MCRPHRILLAISLFLTPACESDTRMEVATSTGWQGTTVQEGSTLTVRTTGGSVWSGPGRLIEEVAIGTETRGEHDLLGEVYGLDATSDRIFILDRIFTTVRVYDWAGNHVVNIGRDGEGPGELRGPTDMGIDPVRGHVVVRAGTGQLDRLTLTGEFVERIRTRGLQGSMSGRILLLRVTREGGTIVPHFSYRRDPDAALGFISTTTIHTVDSAGHVVDSFPLPDYGIQPYILQVSINREAYRPQPVPFGPQEVWSLGWDGAFITGHSSQYRFEIRYLDGRRTIIERDAEPVPVLPEERQWATDHTYAIMRHFDPGWRWEGPDIPDTKPWYVSIIPDRSGRIWVLRVGEGRRVEGWTEPEGWREWERNPAWVSEGWFDVFEEETGRYLGRVDAPAGFSHLPEPLIDGDTFICLTSDELGRPIVRRYRLELPGGDS